MNLPARPRFRASSVPQLLACPAAAILGAIVKPSPDSAASLLGTWCHWRAARTLADEHGATAPSDGLPEPQMPDGWTPSGFENWMVDYYLGTVLTSTDADMAIEVEAEIVADFDRFDLTGHIDAFGITADATEAVGFDLKTGSELVDEAEQNAQVLSYIVLLYRAYPTLRRITFAIVQPRNNPDEGMERVTWATVEGPQLDGVTSYLERELNHVLKNPRQLNSDGWKQCRYCPAAGKKCPAIDQEIKMKLQLTDEHIAAIAAEPTLEHMLDLEMARKKLVPILERAHDALKTRVRAEGESIAAGHRIFIETRNSGREITDQAKAAEILSDLSDDLYHRCHKHIPGEIERVLAEAETVRTGKKVPIDSKDPTKTSGKKLYRDRLGHLTEMKTSEWLRIAPI
ncbi:DUF2800 domain-containing protein [Geminisphaera colitermitum]|uniref:DUF2800 domain-containing protein n=1 Tax=Geminisphaera colitermitum TaxID=1148786 RepID=UPI0002D9EF81|nr:DUF2800 domain-containing protein [Geminisphaera colitermitum]